MIYIAIWIKINKKFNICERAMLERTEQREMPIYDWHYISEEIDIIVGVRIFLYFSPSI
jgi:hypothetical protein